MKKWWYGVGLLLGMAVLLVLQAPGEGLKIIACDVGQGDATILVKGSSQVLIDGGPSGEKVLNCLARQLPYWDRTIELIVMTHADYDHINGLAAVVERYQVSYFVTADGVKESDSFWRLVRVLRERGVEVGLVEQGQIVRVGEEQGGEVIELKVLWPPQVERQYLAMFSAGTANEESKQILGASAKAGDTNARSVVLLLSDGSYRALLTGDSGVQAEKALVRADLVPQLDYLKVGHHGSKTSTSLELLQAAKPKLAVVSVGANNRYGHPAMEVVERLLEAGAKVRRTDQEGEVVVELAGE